MVALQRFGNGESPVASAKLNLIVDSLTGAGNTPINHGGVNDAVNYSLTLRNQDAAGKALIVYAPDGITTLFQITATGVLASPAGAAAASIVTTTTAQTLTNKTLTSPTFSGAISGSITLGAANQAASGLIRLPNGSGGLANFIGWRNGANTADLMLGYDSSNRLYTDVLTATTATAGVQALPANPAGFLVLNSAGSVVKVPYYNN